VRDVLRARLAEGAPTDVTVELRGVGYLASAGVGLLLELRADVERRGARLRIEADPGSVPARVLALSGVATGAG
jgi:anti-anti-sigma factor